MSDDVGLMLIGLSVNAGDRTVLDGINAAVAPGQALLVTGPPASGKSSVLAVCAAEKRPTAGAVTFNGTAVTAATVGQQLGYAPQYSRILDTLTALENVALPLLADGVKAAEAWQRSGDALDELAVPTSSWHNLAEQLSGGQRQRVALARVTVSRPSLLVVDDPTSELDAESAERVAASIRALMREGTTVVLSSTDLLLTDLADERIELGQLPSA